jgi:SPX domain
MVKFSKQFEAQLVPEWKEAFVDYWQLKKDLKKMQVFRDPQNRDTEHSLIQRLLLTSRNRIPFFGSNGNRDRDAIQVIAFSYSLIILLLLFFLHLDLHVLNSKFMPCRSTGSLEAQLVEMIFIRQNYSTNLRIVNQQRTSFLGLIFNSTR